ncbi:hypothetical protein JRO89_XS13G0189900 [Xanthoceras sorbifolium]|uniref:WAT1-related protein n=1 Tax=Xanthoceras sorbifolium TaxID=99658 RepID=A0ABQ8H935_9ROSI|nr:hypothetical protein JRO89_XS13G0189900 [Xanthoceras sorbifolium]
MEVKSYLVGLLPFAAMVVVEVVDVGLTTLSKAAMSKGMSHFVFVVYSNALASLILFPSSFIINRCKREKPPLTFSILCKFFLLSLVGITVMQNCVFTGVNYSSPTLGSAMANLIPAFTFLLAVTFSYTESKELSLDGEVEFEKFKKPDKSHGYFGINIRSIDCNPLQGSSHWHRANTASTTIIFLDFVAATKNNWVIGGIFFAAAGLSFAIMNVSQAAILKDYPSEITLVSFYSFFGAIQCAIVALIAERNPNAWKLRPDIELISVIYSAVFGNAVTYGILAWCIHRKGPVFVAMFKPLGISIAAFMSVIFLGDTLHVGSIIGAIVIVVGFYGVIWAKSKEEEPYEDDRPQSSSQKIPLLGSHVN